MKIKESLVNNYKKILKGLFMLLVIVVVFIGGVNEFKSIDIKSIPIILKHFSPLALAGFAVFGILAVLSMSLYDVVISNYLGIETSKKDLFNLTFVANSANNISGLGGVTGATIRGYLYKNKQSFKDNIKDYYLLLFSSTGIGLSVMLLIGAPYLIAMKSFFLDHKIILAAIVVYLLYLGVYFFIDYGYNFIFKKDKVVIDKRRFILRLKLLIVSFVEWIFALLLIFSISKISYSELKFLPMMVAYSIAQVIGIFSMLPGAIGSFDLTLLIALNFFGVPSEPIVTSILLFRMFYFILPLMVSLISSVFVQSKDKKKAGILNLDRFRKFFSKTSTLSSIILAVLVYLVGILSLIFGLLPTIYEKSPNMFRIVPGYIKNFSNHITITLGILLIFISREIRLKVKRSYRIAFVLLILNTIFSLIGGFSPATFLYSVFVFAMLLIAKNSFYRESAPRDWLGIIVKMSLLFVGLYIYMRIEHLIWKHSLHFSLQASITSDKAFVFFKTILIYSTVAIFMIYYEKTKAKITADSRCEEFDEEKLNRFLEQHKGNLYTHLLYLKDKYIYWYDNSVMFQYALSNDYAIVLSDAVGECSDMEDAFLEFSKFIDEYGYKIVFYQTPEESMPFYHNHGYSFFKLGEMALVSLEEFDITCSKSRDFRNNLSRFRKDGFEFELYPSENVTQELLDTLDPISKEWLAGKDEMGFSLGFFDNTYLEKSDIGVIRNTANNEIVSFASISPAYDNQSISLDLMRHSSLAPKNAMTFLILNLILHYKSLGYKVFNLDMAPLSNVGTSPTSRIDEKMAHMLYTHGSSIYSFDGLRAYKNKFRPEWKSRYLTYKNQMSLPKILLEVRYLIHKKNQLD